MDSLPDLAGRHIRTITLDGEQPQQPELDVPAEIEEVEGLIAEVFEVAPAANILTSEQGKFGFIPVSDGREIRVLDQEIYVNNRTNAASAQHHAVLATGLMLPGSMESTALILDINDTAHEIDVFQRQGAADPELIIDVAKRIEAIHICEANLRAAVEVQKEAAQSPETVTSPKTVKKANAFFGYLALAGALALRR